MNITCDFLKHNLTCMLPENTMDVLLKVGTKSGEHTFREDVYTRTLKYRKLNNELRPFHSLKKRVARMFRKRNSYSDGSRSTSTQTIINEVPEQCKVEVREKDSETDSDRESIHSNWSELIPINNEISKIGEAIKADTQERKKSCEEYSIGSIQTKTKRLRDLEDKISLCNWPYH